MLGGSKGKVVLSILAKMALMTSDIIKVGLSSPSSYCDVKNGHKSPWKEVRRGTEDGIVAISLTDVSKWASQAL